MLFGIQGMISAGRKTLMVDVKNEVSAIYSYITAGYRNFALNSKNVHSVDLRILVASLYINFYRCRAQYNLIHNVIYLLPPP